MSDSQPGQPVAAAFPHLASVYGATVFKSQTDIEALVREFDRCAIFCAAPHGAAASLIDGLLGVAAKAGTKPRVVDISADFRFSTPQAYESVYRHVHPA